MKKFFRLFILCAILLTTFAAQSLAQTVYVTGSGKKYHAKNCDLAKTGKKGLTLDEAKKQGYTPWKSCKVEALPAETKKTPAAKAKKK
jgi:hypothetical protein